MQNATTADEPKKQASELKFTWAEFFEVRIDEVKLGNSIRPLDEKEVASLAESIREHGRLIHPVVVDLNLTLRVGFRRYAACKRLGWTTIPIILNYEDKSEDQWTLWQLDENLERDEGTVFERALWMDMRKTVYERIHPETRHGVAGGIARRGNRAAASEPSFASNAAMNTGRATRTVRNLTFIGERLREYKEKIPRTRIANSLNELLALARLQPELTRDVVQELVKGRASDVNHALRSLGHSVKEREKIPVQIPKVLYDKLGESARRRSTSLSRASYSSCLTNTRSSVLEPES